MKYTEEQLQRRNQPILRNLIYYDVKRGKISMSCGKEVLGFETMEDMRNFMDNFDETYCPSIIVKEIN